MYFHLQGEIQAYYAQNEITVNGRDVQKPMLTFHEAMFPGKWIKTKKLWIVCKYNLKV